MVRKFILLALVSLGICAAAPLVHAAPEGVRDHAGFFSPQAVRDADQEIKRIKQIHGKDLLIETYSGIPEDQKDRFRTEDKNKFFSDWVMQRARAENISGVYILICKAPARLDIEVVRETQKQVFTIADRNRLRDLLLSRFKAGEYDAGLSEGVAMVRRTMDSNPRTIAAPVTPRPSWNGLSNNVPQAYPSRQFQPQRSFSFLSIFVWGFIIVVALLLIGRIFSGMRGGNSGYNGPGYGGGYGGGGGGGGFGSGLGGGLLGGMLGGWLYDSFSGRNRNDNPGYPNQNLPPDPGSFSGGDSSSSSGGDFGGGGGGSDFGGGGDVGGSGGSGGGDF